MPRISEFILTDQYGKPYSTTTFQHAWRKDTAKAGITDRTFHDIRRTAICRLADAGCTDFEVAAITGHTLATVHEIIEFYRQRTNRQAKNAMEKLNRLLQQSKNFGAV